VARRAPTTTCAPSPANSFAVAWPIPELAPVTIATLPVNLIIPTVIFVVIDMLIRIVAPPRQAIYSDRYE
jgi:hypothetical protein